MNMAAKVSKCLSVGCGGLTSAHGQHYCIRPMHAARVPLHEIRGCLRWNEKVIDALCGKWPARLGSALFFSNGVAYGHLTSKGIENGLEQ